MRFVHSVKSEPMGLQIINPFCFRLSLPADWKIHDVFHVSLLKRYHARADVPTYDPVFTPYADGTFEVNAFVDSRLKNNEVKYLFDWEGYGPGERTWQKIENVSAFLPLLNDFHTKNPNKPHDDRF